MDHVDVLGQGADFLLKIVQDPKNQILIGRLLVKTLPVAPDTVMIGTEVSSDRCELT